MEKFKSRAQKNQITYFWKESNGGGSWANTALLGKAVKEGGMVVTFAFLVKDSGGGRRGKYITLCRTLVEGVARELFRGKR